MSIMFKRVVQDFPVNLTQNSSLIIFGE